MEKHLKSDDYYADLYDKGTVTLCRDLERIGLTTDIPSPEEGKDVSDEEKQRTRVAFNQLHMYFVTGERYQKKSETVQKWMARDKARDDFFERARAPRDITCLTCGRVMFESSKHFHSGLDEGQDRVLFFYDCTLNHIPRRAFYDNGEEFKREKPLCPKCRTPLTEDDKTTDEKFITLISCPTCDYTDTHEIERTAYKGEEPDPNFERDRARFCSKEEGEKYVEWMRTLHEIEAVLKKKEEKENEKDLYDEVAKIRRLKIIELEQLLAPVLEKEEFIKLHFKDPEVTRNIVVPFTVHDAKQGREERTSSLALQRIIKNTLEDTNWRLMTEGTHYRLGMLEGRLRAYENEEDLANLLRAKEKKSK